MASTWRSRRAPVTPFLKRLLRGQSHRKKRVFYQVLVFLVTYVAYSMYSMNRRPFIVVKAVLSPKGGCNRTAHECHPWKPFTNHHDDRYLFSSLDFTFMMFFALSTFISGYLAEHTNLRVFLCTGMILCGITTALFGMIKYLKIHSLSYFFIMQAMLGMVASTGFPCVTEAVGMWYPEGLRGITYGIFSTNYYIGNIIGSALSGAFIKVDWGLSFLVPAAIMICFSGLVYYFLIPDPRFVRIRIKKFRRDPSIDDEHCVKTLTYIGEENLKPLLSVSADDEEDHVYDGAGVMNGVENKGIDFWAALKIPGVIEYSICLFFILCVLNTFFFWLPYIIQTISINGKTFNPADAAYYSIFFDVGGVFGGILAGVLYDLTDSPANICAIMLIVTGPNLILFMLRGTTITMFVCYMVMTGIFLTGPSTLITTMVSARLSYHESLRKNTKAIALISSIIDGIGSLGAALGPLVSGFISANKGWGYAAFALFACVLLAAITLIRQCYQEVIIIRTKIETLKYPYMGKQDRDTDECSSIMSYGDSIND